MEPMSATPFLFSNDPVCCPLCGDHFRAVPSAHAPVSFTGCCHTICLSCSDAMESRLESSCPVCDRPLGNTALNIGLGAFAEAVYANLDGIEPECVQTVTTPIPEGSPLSRMTSRGDRGRGWRRTGNGASAATTPSNGRPRFGSDPPKTVSTRSRSRIGSGETQSDMLWSVGRRPSDFVCDASDCTPLQGSVAELRDATPVTSFRCLDDDESSASDGPVTLVSLQRMVSRCISGSTAMMDAAATVTDAKAEMERRLKTSCDRLNAVVDDLKRLLDEHRASIIAEAHHLCNTRGKILDAQADELCVSASQLKAAGDMCESVMTCSDADTVSHAYEGAKRIAGLSRVITEPLQLRVDAVAEVTVCHRTLTDAITSQLSVVSTAPSITELYVASGPGLTRFAYGVTALAKEQNTIVLRCMGDQQDNTLKPSDVEVCVRVVEQLSGPQPTIPVDMDDVLIAVDGLASEHGHNITIDDDGSVRIEYVVRDTAVIVVEVSVIVKGVLMKGSPWIVKCGLRALGNHIQTIPLTVSSSGGSNLSVQSNSDSSSSHNGKSSSTSSSRSSLISSTDGNSKRFGLAVSPNDCWMVVTCYTGHCITVYSLPTGEIAREFGSLGIDPGQFDCPFRVYFSPTGTILVVEEGNRRVQELSMTGRHIRFIGEGCFNDGKPICVAVNDSMIAVGKTAGGPKIVLFDWSTGSRIRSFSTRASMMSDYVSIRFTPDGEHILVAEYSNKLSLFTLMGEAKGSLGVGSLGVAHKDVAFTCVGEVIVADFCNHRVCVFSPDSGAMVRCWGGVGVSNGQLKFPTALAVANNKLYVLDCETPRVQVFE